MFPYISSKIFCDTSFFYASLSKKDVHHEEAKKRLEYASRNRITLVTTWDVISETLTLLRYLSSYQAAIEFLDVVLPTLEIVVYENWVKEEAKQIFRQFGKDKIFFCDAISSAAISQILDHIPCLSFGDDFRSLGVDCPIIKKMILRP